MTTSTEHIARQLEALRKRVDAGLRTPQLIYSSIDNGAVPVKDSDGNTTAVVGKQWDATWGAVTTGGPIPPTPLPPVLTSVPGGVNVHVTGDFEDPQPGFTSPVVAPMTFARFEIDVDTTINFDSVNLVRTSVSSAAGGDRSINWPQGGTPLYARLRTRDQSGKLSASSTIVGPVNSGKVQ